MCGETVRRIVGIEDKIDWGGSGALSVRVGVGNEADDARRDERNITARKPQFLPGGPIGAADRVERAGFLRDERGDSALEFGAGRGFFCQQKVEIAGRGRSCRADGKSEQREKRHDLRLCELDEQGLGAVSYPKTEGAGGSRLLRGMGFSKEYREKVEEALSKVVEIRTRPMFGGVGIYAGDLFFALIAEDRLYFKTGDLNREDFEKEGMEPFFT